MRWTVVIPVKALPGAKSRLAEAAPGARQRAQLAAALRADTIAAALATSVVARVLLVVDAPTVASDGVQVLVQTAPGLNAAVSEGAAHATRCWPDDAVAALLGDLPALRPDELAAALDAARHIDYGYVRDAAGTGTTLLTARPGAALQPAFGPDSAARHARFATVLPAGPGLRRDVDTLDDLRSALDLGVGPHTLTAAAAAQQLPPTSVVHLSGR
jgi:2-phospho-L-lactate guanylyltransferase